MRFLLIISMLFTFTACERISTGHVGIRTTFSGNVEPQELGTGFHQTLIGDVRTYVANEITWKLDDLHPQTKDRSSLNDLDISYNYSINPSKIGDLVVKYKGRDFYDRDNREYYPLAYYVENVVKTATTDVFSKYDALDANQNREKIRDEIKTQAESMFKEDGLADSVDIHQIFIKNLQLSQAIMDSANAVIISQNVLKSKEYEVQTAKKEAERVTLLSANKANLDYIRANALDKIADGVKEGRVKTVLLPYDFRGLINVND